MAKKPQTIGVLALQGAFREHRIALERCRASVREVRTPAELGLVAALVIPGGESTTMMRLLRSEGMLEPMQRRIAGGMPVYGSCAGMILLCREVEGSSQPCLGALDAVVRRNAYGRQADSFTTTLDVASMGPMRAVFIRAPMLTKIGPAVSVLAEFDGHPVAVRQGAILATAFHPELTGNLAMHRYFLALCGRRPAGA